MTVAKRNFDLLTALSRLLPTRSKRFRPLRAGVLRTALRLGIRPGATPAALDHTARMLGVALPDRDPAELRAAAKRHHDAMYDFGMTRQYLDAATPDEARAFCRDRLVLEGAEHLHRVRDHDGPVVLFTSHYGVPILALLRIMLELNGSKRVNTFYADPEVNPGNARYREIIEKLGTDVNVLYDDARAVRGALGALKRKEVLTMQPDVYDNRNGSAPLVPFLGGLVPAMNGTAFFALRTNALVVPVHCYQTGPLQYTVRFDGPMEPVRTASFDDDVHRLTADIHALMDAQIRAAPEHWNYWDTLAERLVHGVRLPDASQPEAWRDLLPHFGGGEAQGFVRELQARLAA
jgi:KDO2-lipid IV(A) lauroyltransferase